MKTVTIVFDNEQKIIVKMEEEELRVFKKDMNTFKFVTVKDEAGVEYYINKRQIRFISYL